MGWTGGQLDARPTAHNLIAFDLGADFAARVIATAKLGSVVYAAVRAHDDPSVVFGLVLLTERRDGMVYTKPIDETMGPCEDMCPARILDLLTDTDSEYANQWRARCRARLAKPKPKAGQAVRFAHPFTFTNGESHDTLTFVKGSRFKTPNGTLVHVTKWRESTYEVV